MVVLPHVFLRVDVILVNIVAHIDVSVRIVQFRVVMVGHNSERIESVGVDGASGGKSVPFIFGGLFIGGDFIGPYDIADT